MEEFEKLVAEAFQAELIPAEKAAEPPAPQAVQSTESSTTVETMHEEAPAEEQAG
jgi:hypothetical protein